MMQTVAAHATPGSTWCSTVPAAQACCRKRATATVNPEDAPGSNPKAAPRAPYNAMYTPHTRHACTTLHEAHRATSKFAACAHCRVCVCMLTGTSIRTPLVITNSISRKHVTRARIKAATKAARARSVSESKGAASLAGYCACGAGLLLSMRCGEWLNPLAPSPVRIVPMSRGAGLLLSSRCKMGLLTAPGPSGPSGPRGNLGVLRCRAFVLDSPLL
mmetsp:Transcript_43456/g.82923  ORF Transcript_43456/g.82923 Transcript_43456/m.82923 type:complete len:217 (+) Transcript_43456:406-1056(+)